MRNLYRNVNNSFKKKLVYHLGSEAGFFSEYNNMILAIIYCLENKIRFELYSKDANFRIEKGWEDYFEPFCDETVDKRHSKYNHRQPSKLSFHQRIDTFVFQLVSGIDYLTHDLWSKFHNKELENKYFDFQSLGIKGDLQEVCSQLIQMTWKYNKETKIEIEKIAQSLEMPNSFIGMHIRGGDKFIEYDQIEIKKYFEIANQVSDLKDVFILTDDYQIIIEIKKLYPAYNFFTLCNENERGYYHNDFSSSNIDIKKSKLLNLFTSIDVLSRGDFFIGTYSSNPGMYLGMRMPKNKVYGVDLEKWTVW